MRFGCRISFLISLLVYLFIVFIFSIVLKNKKDYVAYTDTELAVKLIQGSILSSAMQNKSVEENDSQYNEVKKDANDSVASMADTKGDNHYAKKESFIDPFENINVDNIFSNKDSNIEKINSINKSLAKVDKSVSNISNQKFDNNVKTINKHGNSSAASYSGKYNRYIGSVNRILNDIWQLYIPKKENAVKVTIKINLQGFLEVLYCENVNDADYMSNVNMFFDRIKKEYFGIPPYELVIDILLQTNKNNQAVIIN